MADEDPDIDGNDFVFNLRFPGQYFTIESELHYNYFRDYDPRIGRYVQSDPIGLQGGLNTYAYVAGNPLMSADPLGLVITGRWIRIPYAHSINLDFRGASGNVGNWRWLPPSVQIALVNFYGSAIISFEIECKEDKCDEHRTWTIAGDHPAGTDFSIPIRLKLVSHWVLTAAKIAQAAEEAYPLIKHWSAGVAASYYAIDPVNWCQLSATLNGLGE